MYVSLVSETAEMDPNKPNIASLPEKTRITKTKNKNCEFITILQRLWFRYYLCQCRLCRIARAAIFLSAANGEGITQDLKTLASGWTCQRRTRFCQSFKSVNLSNIQY